jgi:hypothetical protein
MESRDVHAPLSEILMGQQRKTAFLYLQKKLLDAGKLSKPDFLYLLLVGGHYDNLGKSALAMDIPEDDPDTMAEIDRQIFLAAVTSSDPAFWRTYEERLSRYSNILEAYFSDIPLEKATIGDLRVLIDNYPLLAFAAGLDMANRLASVFSAYPARCFAVKARYYHLSHHDAELSRLNRGDIPIVEKDSLFYVCRSMIRSGDYEGCLTILERMLDEGVYDDMLFHLLFILSRRRIGHISDRANTLSARHLYSFNNMIDALDEQVMQAAAEQSDASDEAWADDAQIISLPDYRAATL